jgi:hypothetical protein
MYLNKIDLLLDKITDDFYATITNTQILKKILSETNFVKFQKELTELLKSYCDKINLSEIEEILKNTSIKIKIQETIKRYLCIYLFLYIGFFYVNSDSTFMNNIVEFTKNSIQYNYKIDNFFNSESNALIVKYFQFIKQLINFIETDTPQKIETLKARIDYKSCIEFYNTFGKEFFDEIYIQIKDKNLQAHNIIKTIILYEIYRSEKKELYKLIEILDSSDGEFIFIDIVLPTKTIIDFRSIELLLSKKDLAKGYAYVIWDYLTEYNETLLAQEKSLDEKIADLFESGLLIPIVDDYLLYHKDGEKYEKNEKNKIKEDTKIKFIIDKLNSVTNINEESKEETKKYFYTPLNYKKAVLINNFENIKIIQKIINQGKITTENAEFLKELEDSTLYPYINFKSKPNSINISVNKTIDCIRAVSFDTTDQFKQKPNAKLQMRIGSNQQQLNVIGVMIPSNLKSPYCIKNKDVTDIRNLGDNDNGYKLTTEFIQETLISDKNFSESVFWLFDFEKDNVELETYEQTAKMTTHDNIKIIIGRLYDNIIDYIYNEIIEKCKLIYKNTASVGLQSVFDFINRYESNKIKITKIKSLNEKISDELFNSIITRKEIKYDEFDDKVYGLTEDIIELPQYTKSEEINPNKFKISTEFIKEEGITVEKEKVDGICQHNITWDRISELKISNTKLFLDELYQYIQTYVQENADHDYVCKSCGFFLNIKKYVQDGKYDDSTQRFIVYGLPLDTPLEDIPEYEKYRGTIRSIDKNIEKIALINNLSYFLGNSINIKSRRKIVIKDAIDLILLNNELLKKVYKTRNESISKLYGISNSNLFVFELESNIFIFSSKDKDFLKPIKQNNVIGYLIFLLILELNESQITMMNVDKKGFCNFFIFEKIYQSLFEGLKFRKNNQGDVVPVKNYPIFCYVLYIMACFISKYNLWYYDFKDAANDKAKRNKLLPTIQKIIINTVIDIINSVLENSVEKKVRIYEVIVSKFYNKLGTTFSNQDLYNKFKADSKASLFGESKTFILTKPEAYKLPEKFSYPKHYEKPIHWRKCFYPKNYLNYNKEPKITTDSLSNITNCIKGNFHSWEFSKDDKTFQCTNCKEFTSKITVNPNSINEITKIYKNIQLKDLAVKYCFIDGNLHLFQLQNEKNICIKCKKDQAYQYTDGELSQLNDMINKNYIEKSEKFIETTIENKENINKKLTYLEKIYEKINTKFLEATTKDNQYKYIDKLIDFLEKTIGDELIKTHIYLKDNIYLFTHDHTGVKYDKPIIILDRDNKITYKENHPQFNVDVISYQSYKNGKIDVFYDANTHIMLGYREESKQIIYNRNPKVMMKIAYSIYNKIKQIGIISEHINVKSILNDIQKDYLSDLDYKEELKKNPLLNEEIFEKIILERYKNLKNIIYKFQQIITRIINSYSPKKKEPQQNIYNTYEDNFNEETYFSDKLLSIVEKYSKKIGSIELSDEDGSNVIFKHWKGVTDILIPTKVKNIEIPYPSININYINENDKNGLLLHFYVIDNLYNLCKYNESNHFLSNLIIDFINVVFDLYNEDKFNFDIDFKQFYYFIHSATYIDELKDVMGVTEGVYEELQDEDKELTEEEKDALEDAKEEEDALDVEGDEIDYLATYDRIIDRAPDNVDIDSLFSISYGEYKLQISTDEYYS